MGRIALCFPNQFSAEGVTYPQASVPVPDMTKDRAFTAQPMEAFAAAFGEGAVSGMPLGGSAFDVDGSNDYVDWTDGVTTWAARVSPHRTYTKRELLDKVVAAMNAAEGVTTISGGFTASGAFYFLFPGNRTLLVSSGANASTSLWAEMGWASTVGGGSDSAAGVVHVAPQVRHNPHTFVAIDCGEAKSVDVVTAILFGDDSCDYSDVMVFGGDLGLPGGMTRHRLRNVFNTYFPTELALSNRPSRDMNYLQGAIASSTVSHRYWVFSWRDLSDGAKERFVGHVGAWPANQSSSMHVRKLRGHRPVDLGEPMGVSRYYTQTLPKFWRLPVALEQWPIQEYRNTWVTAIEKSVTTEPCVVLVNYNDIRSGDLNWNDEADRGLALYACMTEFPSGADWVGEAAVYADAEFVFEQVR